MNRYTSCAQSRVVLATLGLLLVAACDDERGGGNNSGEQQRLTIDQTVAVQTTTTNLRNNLVAVAEAVSFAPRTDMARSMEGLAEDLQSSDEENRAQPAEKLGVDDAVDEAQEMRDAMNEAVDWLRDHIFQQAETQDGTSVTYLIGPAHCKDLVEAAEEDCERQARPLPPEGDDGNTDDEEWEDDCTSEEDRQAAIRDCSEFLTDVPLRIRVTSAEEGNVDLTLLVGAEQLEVFTLGVHRQELTFEIDLASTMQAIELVLEAMGEEGEEVQLPDVLEGVLALSLKVEGPRKVTLTSAVQSALRMEMTLDGQPYRFSLAPSTSTLTADGAARTITGSLAAGALDLALPFQQIVNSYYDQDDTAEPLPRGEDPQPAEPAEQIPDAPGELLIHLAGLSAGTTFSAEQDGNEALTLTGLGLGDGTTTVKLNATTLFSLDLNAATGRTFDLTITPRAQGPVDEDGEQQMLPELAFTPGLDLSLLWNLQAVIRYFHEEDFLQELLDETWRLTLDQAPTPTLRVLDQETENASFGIEMLAGRMTLQSTKLDDDILVEQGMCLAGEPSESRSPQPAEGEGEPEPRDSGNDEPRHLFTRIFATECP